MSWDHTAYGNRRIPLAVTLEFRHALSDSVHTQPEMLMTRAAILGAALLLLSSCGSAASHSRATASPVAVASGTFPAWSTGPSGSSGPGYSGPTYSGSTGPNYSGYTGATGPHPGCRGLWSYGLCIPQPADSGPTFSPPSNTDLGFNCRIAVSNGSPGSGGFIKFPGGDFTLDPHSDVSITYPPGAQSGMGSPPPTFGLSFNSHSGRWFPVSREAVSPDGSKYAYTYDKGIHVITAANGSDAVLGSDRTWRLLLLDNSGAYAVPADQTAGLWFVPLTGTAKQVTGAGVWMTASASSGVAYGMRAQSVPSGASNPVIRLILSSGAIQTWWSEAPAALQQSTVGPDGSLIVAMPYEGGTWQIVDIRRVVAPEQADPVVSDSYGTLLGPVVADAHGIWLTVKKNYGASYTWLASGQGYQPVSKVADQLASGCD